MGFSPHVHKKQVMKENGKKKHIASSKHQPTTKKQQLTSNKQEQQIRKSELRQEQHSSNGSSKSNKEASNNQQDVINGNDQRSRWDQKRLWTEASDRGFGQPPVLLVLCSESHRRGHFLKDFFLLCSCPFERHRFQCFLMGWKLSNEWLGQQVASIAKPTRRQWQSPMATASTNKHSHIADKQNLQ